LHERKDARAKRADHVRPGLAARFVDSHVWSIRAASEKLTDDFSPSDLNTPDLDGSCTSPRPFRQLRGMHRSGLRLRQHELGDGFLPG